MIDCENKNFSLNGEKVLAYGFAGILKGKEVFEYALEEGINVTSSLDSDDDFSCIVVTERNAYHISKLEEGPGIAFIHIPDDVPFACGSGRSIALHFLTTTNCDPVDAVVEATKTDLYSGGEIMRWSRK